MNDLFHLVLQPDQFGLQEWTDFIQLFWQKFIWHREIIEEFAMSLVNEMNLNMEKREILHVGKHNRREENEDSPNISSCLSKKWILKLIKHCGCMIGVVTCLTWASPFGFYRLNVRISTHMIDITVFNYKRKYIWNTFVMVSVYPYLWNWSWLALFTRGNNCLCYYCSFWMKVDLQSHESSWYSLWSSKTKGKRAHVWI